MVVVNEEVLVVNPVGPFSGGATYSRTPTKCSPGPFQKKISLHDSIGIMHASYTRAVTIQEGSCGSLFRQKTKSECLNNTRGITPSFYNTTTGTSISNVSPEIQYPQLCFKYIHENPVRAGLVSYAEEWEVSSVKDFAGMREGIRINKKVANE